MLWAPVRAGSIDTDSPSSALSRVTRRSTIILGSRKWSLPAAGAPAAWPSAGGAGRSAPAGYGRSATTAEPRKAGRRPPVAGLPTPLSRCWWWRYGRRRSASLQRVVVRSCPRLPPSAAADDPRSPTAGDRGGRHRRGDPRQGSSPPPSSASCWPLVIARSGRLFGRKLYPHRPVSERAEGGARADLYPLVRLRPTPKGSGIDRGDRLLPGDAVDPDRHRSGGSLR